MLRFMQAENLFSDTLPVCPRNLCPFVEYDLIENYSGIRAYNPHADHRPATRMHRIVIGNTKRKASLSISQVLLSLQERLTFLASASDIAKYAAT
jgi:hypothetical protein